jgi:hypothetical protein
VIENSNSEERTQALSQKFQSKNIKTGEKKIHRFEKSEENQLNPNFSKKNQKRETQKQPKYRIQRQKLWKEAAKFFKGKGINFIRDPKNYQKDKLKNLKNQKLLQFTKMNLLMKILIGKKI